MVPDQGGTYTKIELGISRKVPDQGGTYRKIELGISRKVLHNFKLGISWIFLNIQAANISKLLPENPTNHADSRTFKNIQDVHKTLDIVRIS